MASDPTGFAGAIKELPESGLSSRQQRVAAAIAMVKNGHTQRDASEATGIPKTTLYRALRGIGTIRDQGKQDEAATRAILEASQAISLKASEVVMEGLDDPNVKLGDAVKAFGVAVDKIHAFGQTPSSQGDGVAALLQGILDQADVTITKRAPERDAVDVTPSESGE